MFVIRKSKLLALTATLVALAFFAIVAAAGSHTTTNGFNQAGNVLITDPFNNRVIEINPAQQVVYQYGMLNDPGNGANQLDAPYTAYVIGDYAGQTPPPLHF